MKPKDPRHEERKERDSFKKRLWNRLIKETFVEEIARWKQIHYEINTYGDMRIA